MSHFMSLSMYIVMSLFMFFLMYIAMSRVMSHSFIAMPRFMSLSSLTSLLMYVYREVSCHVSFHVSFHVYTGHF